MDTKMANSLILVLLLLLLELTVETVPFQQCCPEDNYVFIQDHNTCNSSRAVNLICNNNSSVIAFTNEHDHYWFNEMSDSAIIGSEDFGLGYSHESFCVANFTPSYDDWEIAHNVEGLVLCQDAKPSSTYLGPQLLNYVICSAISGTGCFLTFLTYIVVPALRKDLLNKCLICALLCFMFAYMTFTISLKEMHMLSHPYCAYQILFFFFWTTAAGFWTNVVSFHIWRTVVFKRFPINEPQLLKVYHFWGWGIPLALLLIATTLEAMAVGKVVSFTVCRISSTEAFILMLLPFPLLLFLNFLYFVWTMWKLCRQEVPSSSDLKFTKYQRIRYKCFLYLKLFLVMGVLWIFRSISMYLPGTQFTGILLDSLTLLQGLFIFLVLVVFQKKALLGLAEQFAKWGCPCPFVTTDLAATSNEECSEDGSNVEVQKNATVFDAKEIETEDEMKPIYFIPCS